MPSHPNTQKNGIAAVRPVGSVPRKAPANVIRARPQHVTTPSPVASPSIETP